MSKKIIPVMPDVNNIKYSNAQKKIVNNFLLNKTRVMPGSIFTFLTPEEIAWVVEEQSKRREESEVKAKESKRVREKEMREKHPSVAVRLYGSVNGSDKNKLKYNAIPNNEAGVKYKKQVSRVLSGIGRNFKLLYNLCKFLDYCEKSNLNFESEIEGFLLSRLGE